MNIELHQVSVRDLYEGYTNDSENGVKAFGGKLDVRPPFQREFVYDDKKRNPVIDTVRKNFPLNVLYWVHNIENDTYECLDGQQRTISICSYIHGDYSINYQYFFNLEKEEQDQILDYQLMVYFCEGTIKEKLDWFKTINIAGEKLFDQELRNAIYVGHWLHEAKKYFSKRNCPCHEIASDYLNGSSIRQDYLETALKWRAAVDNSTIEDYMAAHQHDTNCTDLWLYFQNVINWVKTIFPTYRKEMKGIEWGLLYNKFKDNSYDPSQLEDRIKSLMMDDEVTKKKGIYQYLLSGDEKYLSLRAFTPSMKREAYEKQGGICPICGKHFEIDEMEADHVTPWSEGGKTIIDNCQMLCKECNRRKSNK